MALTSFILLFFIMNMLPCAHQIKGCPKTFRKSNRMAQLSHSQNCRYKMQEIEKTSSSKKRAYEVAGAPSGRSSLMMNPVDRTPEFLGAGNDDDGNEYEKINRLRPEKDSGKNVLESENAPFSSETDSENELADLLGLALISMRGKKFSVPGIERILDIVTNKEFCAASTKKLFYNMYTLKKHRERKEEQALIRSGFKSQQIKVTKSDILQSASKEQRRWENEKGDKQFDFEGPADVSSGDENGFDSDSSCDEKTEQEDVEGSAEAVLWMRDPCQQLRLMIDQAVVGKDIFLEGKPEYTETTDGTKVRVFKSAMGSDLAVDAFPKVKKAIKKDMSILNAQSDDDDILWYNGTDDSDGKVSFVGGLIAYSDKTNSTRWKLFYPVHICLMNFSEEFRQRMIDKGLTIVGFLPTAVTSRGGLKMSRLVKQTVLHASLRKIFDTLGKSAMPGIYSSNGKLICHNVLSNYVTDCPEGKDLSCTLYSIHTALPCTGCIVPKGSLADFTGDKIIWREQVKVKSQRDEARDLILQANALQGKKGAGRLRDRGENLLKESSLSIVTPFYDSWPYIDGRVHKLLDAHRIFGFERLHDLAIGMEKIIIESSINVFIRAPIFSSSIKTAKGEPRLCSTFLPQVLEKVNTFLTETHHFSPMPNLRLDFDANGGLLTKKGTVGMLEAKDLLSVLTVFPFIGMIFDLYLGWEPTNHFTELFTLYTEISQKIYGRYVDEDSYFPKEGFTHSELKQLMSRIKKFKNMAKRLLGSVEKHGLEAFKMHLLDHAYEDLKRMGNVFIMAADAWEAAHKRLKEAFRATSQRNESFLQETIIMLESREHAEQEYQALRGAFSEDVVSSDIFKLAGKAVDKKSLEAINADSAALAKGGSPMTLGGINSEALGHSCRLSKVPTQGSGLQLRPVVPVRKPRVVGVPEKSEARLLAEEIGFNGVEMLLNLVIEKEAEMKGFDANCSEYLAGQAMSDQGVPLHVQNLKIFRIASGRVASMGVPDTTGLRYMKPDEDDEMDKESESSASSADQSSRSSISRSPEANIPCSLITIRKHQRRQLDSLVAHGSFYGRYRYDSVLLELEGYSVESAGPLSKDNGKRDAMVLHAAKALSFFRIPNLQSISEEWVLVQYYEVVTPGKGYIAEAGPKSIEESTAGGASKSFDALHNCIKLQWAKKDGEPYLDLLPLSCLRGKVQIIRCSEAVSCIESRKGKDMWEEDFFYINRFCTSGPSKSYNTSDRLL